MRKLKVKSGENKYSTLAKNTALFSISSMGSKFISFLLIPVYTYILNTEEYGMLDLLTTTTMLIIPILTLNIQDAVMRFVMDRDFKPKDVITTAVKINLIGAGLLLVILCGLKLTNFLKLDNIYLLFLFLNYLLNAFQNSFTLYLKGRERVSVLVVSGLLQTGLVCGLNILLLIGLKWGVVGYIFANIIGQLIAIMYMFIIGNIYTEIHLIRYNDLSKKMVSYSYPLIFNSLAWWINNASDRYILTFFCGVSVNGVYSIAYKIPTILSTLQNVFYNAWSISAIKEFDKNDSDGFIGKTYQMYSSLSIVLCSIIMLMNVFIAKILYSKEFFEAWVYVPFLLVGTTFNGIALFQGCIFTAVKKTKEVSKSTIIGSVVNTICNVVFIYFEGAMGAALATMIGYMITWGIRTFSLRNIIHMKVDWRRHIYSIVLLVIQAILAINESTYYIQSVFLIMQIILYRRYIFSLVKIIYAKATKCINK